MPNRRHLTFAAGASLLVGFGLAACADRPSRPADDTRPPQPVRSTVVALTDVVDSFETGGTVQARTTAVVMSRIAAPVTAVHVAPGDRVRRGQVLVELDSRDLSARTRGAEAALSGAEQRVAAADAEVRAADAALSLARATHRRIASLHEKRSATSQELDEAAASVRAAEAHAAAAAARRQGSAAAVESAKAEGDAAGTIQSFARIASPFDGIVTEKMVEPGNMASPGVPLLRVEDTRNFRLDARIDESRIGALSIGARVTVEVDGGDGATAATRLDGSVVEIARAVDSDARALLVKIELPTAAGLRSGMFGRARFPAGTRRVLTIPPEAVVRRGQVASVFVVSDGIARLRLVNMAGREVLAGLVEGERVVVDPPPDLVDGRRVSEEGIR